MNTDEIEPRHTVVTTNNVEVNNSTRMTRTMLPKQKIEHGTCVSNKHKELHLLGHFIGTEQSVRIIQEILSLNHDGEDLHQTVRQERSSDHHHW